MRHLSLSGETANKLLDTRFFGVTIQKKSRTCAENCEI